ncbi:Crp/Fnr family transcriptional regulator [Desulfosarcina cetonica]|uniref:Crp/Fnr family transcriptional regulator n=1 Tax=Desulfosarcina cetonica TaxID=90730 RepID=UPI0006D04749|nr:Crp/Fnr family transcriptional regulator [Desulfosarcina cetonica]
MKKERDFFLNLLGEGKEIILKKAGETIVNVGQPGEYTYLLKAGTAQIDLFGGKHTVEIGPGNLIGLMGSIDGRDYEDTTVAITDCELIPIDRKRAEYLFREHPTFAFHIIKVLIDRFYFALDLAKQYCQAGVSI